MGIISEIGRKDIRVRLLIWCISISLMVGAVTMIYPFALMISGSSKSSVDVSENKLIPGFLTDDKIMYQKSIESLFNEGGRLFQSTYDIQNGDFKQLELPDDKDINSALVNDWNQFVNKCNYKQYYYGLSFVAVRNSRNTVPVNLRRFKSMLSKRFDGKLDELNQAMQLELVSWNALRVSAAAYLSPRVMPNADTELYNTYYAFKEKFFDDRQKNLSLVNRYFINPEGYYKTIYLRAQYTQKIGNYNAKHKTKYASWYDVKLTRNYPADKKKYTDLQRADWDDFVRTLLNRFWIKVKPEALPIYHAYLQARYENKIVELNRLYGSKYKSFNEMKLVTQRKEFPFFGARLSDWNQFIQGWNDAKGKRYKVPVRYLEITGAIYDFRDHLKNKYKTIAAANELFDGLNKGMQDKYDTWNAKLIVDSKALANYSSFLKAKYNNKIAVCNKLYGLAYKSFDEIKMPTQLNEFSSFRKVLYDWGRFIVGWTSNNGQHYQLPIENLQLTAKDIKYKTITAAKKAVDAAEEEVDASQKTIANAKKNFVKLLAKFRVDAKVLPIYHAYLKDIYSNKIAVLNGNYDSKYKAFAEIKLVTQLKKFPAYGTRLSDWSLFLVGKKIVVKDIKPADTNKAINAADKAIVDADELFVSADTVLDEANKQFDITQKAIIGANMAFFNANKAFNHDAWSDVRSQQQASHYLWIKENSAALKWEFVKRNFISVFDYIVLHGYAIWNTFVYCGCAVLCALIVNPLAAYALSRFNPPSTYKILLFLMVTMAFPPMVTQIPVFLLLRELSLLNTYGALVLPALANGYSIFLLKGFFDSLPQELYESAQIDGASEVRIFLQITMSLSKPILAVIGLQTFQMAYSNFMMALLVCQDENMWTIMPWLYQLQSNSCQGVIFASLIIAAIPTFLVFTFCQNIIMRGIVVPVEK
jgi:ABC-type glycerol-3-phosphate transport system permease component